ncbi:MULTISPECIES: hypothetical protein [unclassified Lysobacter]
MQAKGVIVLLFSGLLLAGSVVHAGQVSAPADAAAVAKDVAVTNADDDGDRMVCEYEKRIGSNMKTRICKTARVRERERELSRAAMEGRSICANCGGD